MKHHGVRGLALLLAGLLLLSGCADEIPDSSEESVATSTSTGATSTSEGTTTDTQAETTDTTTGDASVSTTAFTTTPTTAAVHTTTPKPTEKITTTAPTTATTQSIMDQLAAAPRWKQTKFYLSTFNATGQNKSEEVYRRALVANKEAGINLIENSIMNTQNLITCMDICEELELDFLAQDISQFSGMGTSYPANNPDMLYNIVERYSHYEHMVGYFLWDEPSESNFRQFKVKQDILKGYDPGSLIYSLLLPSYGAYVWDPSNMEDSAYKRYVDTYVADCDPDVLSVDYYPLQKGTESLMENNLWRDLGYFRYKSLESGKPLWFYFQANTFQKELTDAQVQVQMYAALAYGTVGLSYYCTNGSLTDAEGNRTPRYEGLKAINQKVLNLGNFLFDKKDGNLYHTGLSEALVSAYSLDRVTDAACPFAAAPDGLIVGTFTDANGTYLVIVNKDYSAAVNGTLQLKKAHNVHNLDLSTGKLNALQKADTIALTIPAGDCVVYRLS